MHTRKMAWVCLLVSSMLGGLAGADVGTSRRLTLDECIALAKANNERSAISDDELRVARATLDQALSSYWPRFSADVKATRMDEDPVFTFPGTSFTIPAMNMQIPSMTVPVPPMKVNLPAQQLGPISVPPQSVTVPGQTFRTAPQTFRVPAQTYDVPEQKIKVMDRDLLIAGVHGTLPLYTGGLRPALIDQARAGISAAEQQVRRTDADLVYETTHFYYGAVLAAQLVATAKDTLERMEATQDLTERMYNTGSGRVKKTDFLRTRSMVEIIRGSMVEAESRRDAARAALSLAIGAGWQEKIEPADTEVPFEPESGDLASLIKDAQGSSPDLARAEAGLRAAEAKIREARSGQMPKVGIIGSAAHFENDSDDGMADAQNADSWLVGVGAELSLFEGFRTRSKIRESLASFDRMKHYRELMADVVALQVQLAWLDLDKSTRQETSARTGLAAATENRELNVRAYQDELVETKDVIEAQIMEAVLKAQYQKVIFEHADAKGRLAQIVGGE